ncbi:MAG TPA: ADP-forming succinate--CoA ligase subunit beta [Gammaproteobacteria bacterium]|nr:ADP-forming succinate--CoA ligase subunit beta [Gammaproteobacteria bacterium]
MNLHEYQSKQLFSGYGIRIPQGQAVSSVAEAVTAVDRLGGKRWVVKAQVYAGGRGKGGGVKLCDKPEQVREAVGNLLGSQLVTPQTDSKGLPVNMLLIEQASDIARELYLGILVDRSSERLVFMASTEGGMNIEEVAATRPEKILKVRVEPAAGLQAYQCRQLAFGLQLEGNQVREFTKMMLSLFQLFRDKDASLLEINPLIVTREGDLMALDAKINLDDNALYRQPALAEMHDESQEDQKELQASQFELNYITLDGNIGCMVNGAGLAMATMDLIKLQGGQPANFLDVGGGVTKERVAEAFKIVLSDGNVKAILVNIFGGIVRCDLIAEGIVAAVREVGTRVPVVVRLQGTNVDQGRAILDSSRLDIHSATDFTEAATRVVAAAQTSP